MEEITHLPSTEILQEHLKVEDAVIRNVNAFQSL